MKKKYISDVWKLRQKGHENFDFVDVAVNDDNLLFIDPCLIERWSDAWAIKAMKHINSYSSTFKITTYIIVVSIHRHIHVVCAYELILLPILIIIIIVKCFLYFIKYIIAFLFPASP